MSRRDTQIAELAIGLLFGDEPQSLYEASPTKRRRSSRAEMESLKSALHRIVNLQRPMTVRQVFYQATVQGLVDKSEAGYSRVQRILAEMRKAGEMPFGWIADNTRAVYAIDSFESPAA